MRWRPFLNNKFVRDKIPIIIEPQRKTCVFEIFSHKDCRRRLWQCFRICTCGTPLGVVQVVEAVWKHLSKDEKAGQVSPQMAIGSLFRSRRAIVVGDPKQVEPVVTDEMDLIKQIIQDDFTSLYQSKTH